jgi:hypothetical protein
LGILLIRFGVDDILNTTELIVKETLITIASVFPRLIMVFTFSYARTPPGFQYGVNAKIIRNYRKFADSLDFDVGLQFEKNDWQRINGSGHHHHL